MHKKLKEKKTQNENGDKPPEDANGTFWTVCPYCYYLYEYEGLYEECCLRCQNCRRAFQAVAVAAPPAGMVVEGKEQYYCGIGYFPLKYNLECFLGDKKGKSGLTGGHDSFLDEKKEKNEGFRSSYENLVVISDDSDDDLSNKEQGEDTNGENGGLGLERYVVKSGVHGNVRVVEEAKSVMEGNEGTEVKNDGEKVMRKVNSVARNTKKLMGRGKKNMNLESGGNLMMPGAEETCQESENGNEHDQSILICIEQQTSCLKHKEAERKRRV
ncbi:uncharacterized protein LOC105641745 [Jatropha curcas]|uniref:uncharacterized protein LOC105641745 n=1 Tax=Jatropha curcas TaxID=180498 RepID=UPI0018946FB0|nr:uncharacterized protein LOC105641745 [Jatropha curcas]